MIFKRLSSVKVPKFSWIEKLCCCYFFLIAKKKPLSKEVAALLFLTDEISLQKLILHQK